MSSTEETTRLQPDEDGDKETVVASVRLPSDDDKLIRRAAVELDTSRSEFMAEASIQKAREVLKKQRATDQAA